MQHGRLCEFIGHEYLENVEALGIAQVTGADLGGHVPTVKGCRGELHPSAIKEKARDCRQGVPPQAHLPEPFIPDAKQQNWYISFFLFWSTRARKMFPQIIIIKM